MAYIGNSPFVSGNFSSTTHSGTGSSLGPFAIGQSPGTKNAVLVFIDGVRQVPTIYGVSGSDVTFTAGNAPPLGTDNVQILVSGEELGVNVPADDSIAVAALDTTSAGTTGQYLQKSSATDIDWATVPDEVASQTSQSGKYLTTDGSVTSWATVASGIEWQAVQTTGFTAVAEKGYPCNTTAGAFTVTLPASASVGDQISLLDYAGTFDTNAVTIDRNGLKLKGATDNLKVSIERGGVTLTYVDATQGWVATSGVNTATPALESLSYSTDFLVVAGGGGGAYGGGLGGGGGAGGYRTSTGTSGGGASAETALELAPLTVYTIVVGAGAAGGGAGVVGPNGVDSSISGSGITTITSAGGGGGGRGDTATSPDMAGASGGSGGGGGERDAGGGAAGAGTAGQGYIGGAGNAAGAESGGGGGAGEAGNTDGSGYGGDGLSSSITGVGVFRGGGGGGSDGGAGVPQGGQGGGANGRNSAGASAGGTVNTGGGGAGSYAGVTGGTGGSGVVILSMDDAKYSGTTTGSPTVATGVSGKTVLTFNGNGTYTG